MANSVVAFKNAAYAREGLTCPKAGPWTTRRTNHRCPGSAQRHFNACGGYKGVGLAVMVDMLCGALSQNGFSDIIPHFADYDKPRKVGHFLSPSNFRLCQHRQIQSYR
jgi:LDH2 family malate/lactate/ureidoglycolate dehydrogenase